MKNIFWFILLALSFSACNKNAEPGTAATGPEQLSEGIAHYQLNEDQIRLGGVITGTPEKRKVSSFVECTGRVEVPPQSLASVYVPVSGFVQQLRYLPGDYVKQGTFLASISHPDLIHLQREFLESQSRIAVLQKDYNRKSELAQADATSRKSMEAAEGELMMEKVHFKGLKAELKMLGIAVERLEENGEIQPELAVYSPVNGFITKMNINKGKLVGPGDLLYEIVDDSHLHLELQVFSKDVSNLKDGQRIESWVPGQAEKIAAEVHLVGKMIDPETKTTMVHGHFEKEPTQITAGTFLQARIYYDEAEVMAVPEGAVIRQGNESYIFLTKDEGYEKVAVKTGRATQDFVELVDFTLPAGQQVVTNGAYYVNGADQEEGAGHSH